MNILEILSGIFMEAELKMNPGVFLSTSRQSPTGLTGGLGDYRFSTFLRSRRHGCFRPCGFAANIRNLPGNPAAHDEAEPAAGMAADAGCQAVAQA